MFHDVNSGVQAAVSGDGCRILSFLNANAVNIATKDKAFERNLIESDFLFRDGIGVRLAMLMHGIQPGANLNGTDVIPAILQHFRGKSVQIFFWGAERHVSADLEDLVNKDGLSANAHFKDGFQPEDEYFSQFESVAAHEAIVILGMGMPKQEAFADALRARYSGRKLLIINGGAIIDRMSGNLARGPGWMPSYGMEWLYRLACSPRRMLKRYVLGNPVFVVRSIMSVFARGGRSDGR